MSETTCRVQHDGRNMAHALWRMRQDGRTITAAARQAQHDGRSLAGAIDGRSLALAIDGCANIPCLPFPLCGEVSAWGWGASGWRVPPARSGRIAVGPSATPAPDRRDFIVGADFPGSRDGGCDSMGATRPVGRDVRNMAVPARRVRRDTCSMAGTA